MWEDRVTVVISTKDEEDVVGEVIREVRKYVDNIIVIDGHSKDKTREIVKSLGIRVFLDKGRGKGSAIREATNHVTTEIIVFMDADMSHDAEDIPKLILPIIEGKADHVSGSRMLGGSDELYGDIFKAIREIGSHIITLCINYYFNIRLTDTQNGFRAIRTDVIKKLGLKENITTIEQEMIIKTLKKKFVLVEVPTHEFIRKGGKSKIVVSKVWLRYLWCLIKNLYLSA